MKKNILIGLIVIVSTFGIIQVFSSDKYEKVVQDIVRELKIENKEIISEVRDFVKNNWELFELKKAEPEIVVKENPVAAIDIEGFGKMEFELFANDAPQSVYNFIELANSKFYDGLTMHRLVKDFVIQGGDPKGNGSGGPGYSIEGEFINNGILNENKHEIGTLAFARSQDKNSAGSQFYIVTGEKGTGDRMSNDYAAFGKITKGKEVLEKLNEQETGNNDVPNKKIKIKSIKVDTKNIVYPKAKKIH